MTTKLSSLRIVSEFDASGYERGMAAKVAADRQGIASSQNLGAALAAEDAAAGKVSRAVEAMSKAWITGYGHQAKFEAGIRQINRALETGTVSTTRAAALVEGLQRKFGQTADAVQIGQRGFTMLAPVVQEVNDRLAAQSANLTKLQAANSNAVSSTVQFTRGAGLARHEMINLGRQVQDVGTMLAMGQSPFAILASQGAQVADIFATTSASIGSIVRQIGGGALRFATSGAGLATAGAGLGVAAAFSASNYVDGQREVEKALRGVGAASGVTLAQINRLADGQAAAARVSVASARETAAAFAGTGRVNPTQLPGLLGFSREYAAFTGQGTTDAASELAKAFADPTKGAEMLADRLGGLNSAAERWIRDQQAAGNMLGAQTALLDAFRAQVEGSTDRVGLFARAWDTVKRSVSDADDAIGRFLAGSATAEQQLAALQEQRNRFAALPTRTSRAVGRVAEMDAEIARLSAIVELERQRAAIDARVAKAANASRAASAISDRMDSYGATVRELTAERAKLEEAMRLNPRSGDYEAWARSLDKVNTAMSTILPTAERERQAHDLTMRAISARTLAERMAIEVAREGLRLSGDKVSAAEREIAMQRKAAEVAAQAQRDAQDALRASRDQLALAGKSPGERFRLEQEQQRRDNVERFGGVNPAMPAATAAANGLDAAFAESLRKLMAAVPGLTVTSGFRTYDQQAKLYADKGPGWAAPPGQSRHESGMAADLAYKGSGQLPQWVRDEAAKYGITFPLANRARNPEPWHAEPVGGRGRAPTSGSGGVADEIYRNAFTARERNVVDQTLGNSNRELDRQRELLALAASAWGQSAEEIARASKAQELVNALQREGIAISPDLRAQIESTAAGYGALARQQEALRASQEAMRTVGDLGRSVISGMVSDLRNGASGAEMFRNALDKIASKLLDMALNDLFGKAFGNNAMGLFGNGGGGGFFGSLFGGFGGGGNFNPVDFSRGAGGLYGPGFAAGGWTGAGGRNEPAGIVHRGEYVMSAQAVSRIGLGNLDAMHRGALRGYADGGYVTPAIRMPAAANDRVAAANSNSPSKVNVQVINRTTGAVDGSATTTQNPDGSLDVMIDLVEARMAANVTRSKGTLGMALAARADNRQLRG